jgi:hypothetical protein
MSFPVMAFEYVADMTAIGWFQWMVFSGIILYQINSQIAITVAISGIWMCENPIFALHRSAVTDILP